MRTITTITVLTALVGLSACDNSNGGQSAQKSAAASTARSSADQTATAGGITNDESVQLPDYVKLYEGAAVLSRKKETADPNRPGGTIVFTTPDSPDDVVKFYNDQSTSVNNLNLNMNKKTDDGRVYIASDRTREVIVDAKRAGDKTKVKLSWYTQKN